MNEVIIATKNVGKTKEFKQMFAPLGFEVKTLLDYPELADVEETGSTFEENARLKADTIRDQLNSIVIADDSGLLVDALGGRPGVYSARYAGEQKDDEANMDKVLSELEGVPQKDRTARFYCALAISIPGAETRVFSGTCEGEILTEKRGTNGFGYDPIFYCYELKRAMAELAPEEKSQVSHRAHALSKLAVDLPSLFKDGDGL